ncbi:MAG: DNA-methyltransferase [Gemmatimonadaceae bacterium]
MSARIEYRHGSSPEALGGLPDGVADAIVTDPPYGTGTASAIYGRRKAGKANRISNDADLSALEGVSASLARLLAPNGVALLCCAPTLRRAAEEAIERGGLAPIQVLVWDKGAPGISYRVRYAHEDIIVAAHPDYDPWECREPIISPIRIAREREPEHPNEKPVALLRALIRWALPAGGLVLDPFAGIASCGVAAIAERCSYIGVELDPQWWPIAERRLAGAQNHPHPHQPQQSLFGEAA